MNLKKKYICQRFLPQRKKKKETKKEKITNLLHVGVDFRLQLIRAPHALVGRQNLLVVYLCDLE